MWAWVEYGSWLERDGWKWNGMQLWKMDEQLLEVLHWNRVEGGDDSFPATVQQGQDLVLRGVCVMRRRVT